jgi:RHS repeat-associated protein
MGSALKSCIIETSSSEGGLVVQMRWPISSEGDEARNREGPRGPKNTRFQRRPHSRHFAPSGVGLVSDPLQGQSISIDHGEEQKSTPGPPAPPLGKMDRASLAETEMVPAGTTPNSVSRAAVLAAVETWYLTMRDEANRLSTEYVVNPSSVTRTKQYFYFGNLRAATRDAGTGAFVYYHSDHLGTPRLVTRQDKSVAETHKYRPFGEEIAGAFGNQPLKFAAMEQDQAPGKFYAHARHLGMTGGLTGRFLSPDLIPGISTEPQSWNRYTYVLSNPVRNVDPTGLWTTEVTAPCNIDLNCHEEHVTVSAAALKLTSGTLAFFSGDFANQLERAAGSFTSFTDDLALGLEDYKSPLASECRDSLAKRSFANFKTTNDEIPGVALLTGTGLLTAGTVAKEFGLVTGRQFIFSGFRGLMIHGVKHSALSTLATAFGATPLINFVFTSAAFEAGVAAGSVINAGLVAPCQE